MKPARTAELEGRPCLRARLARGPQGYPQSQATPNRCDCDVRGALAGDGPVRGEGPGRRPTRNRERCQMWSLPNGNAALHLCMCNSPVPPALVARDPKFKSWASPPELAHAKHTHNPFQSQARRRRPLACMNTGGLGTLPAAEATAVLAPSSRSSPPATRGCSDRRSAVASSCTWRVMRSLRC